MTKKDPLAKYREKRDFRKTSEPEGKKNKRGPASGFFNIQLSRSHAPFHENSRRKT